MRLILFCATLFCSGFSAIACDCAIPSKAPDGTRLSKEQMRAWYINRSSHVATVEITRMSIEKREDGEMEAVADARLLESIKGDVPKRFNIRSNGGDEGANCGRASSLFVVASHHETLTVSLYPDKKNKGMFYIGLCGLVERGGFGSAAR